MLRFLGFRYDFIPFGWPMRHHVPGAVSEIYVYFALRIYMTLYVCNEISDYWDTKDFTPIYPISKEMSKDRF
jgi:hypothetical protein